MTALRPLTRDDVKFLAATDADFAELHAAFCAAWAARADAERAGKWRWVHAAEQALAVARSKRDARGLEVLIGLEADAATYAAPVEERRAAELAVAA